MILLGKLRRCHFTLLIIHRIARQFQSGAENGNDFIQDGIRTNATVTGVQVEIQILNVQRTAFCRFRFPIAAAGWGDTRLIPRVSHISDGTHRAFPLAATAMVDTASRIHNDRNRSFMPVINTVGAEIDAGAALRTD